MLRVAAWMVVSLMSLPALAQDASNKPIELALITAPEPVVYTMENKSHLGGLIHVFRNMSLGDNLSLDIMRIKPRLADIVNKEVAEALNGKATISDAPNVQINQEKPWKLDYSTLSKHSKPVLFIYIDSIGVKSQTNEAAYRPFAYLSLCITTPKYKNDCTEVARATFGDSYDRDYEEHMIIGSVRGEQWRSADEVYQNLPEVINAYNRVLPRMARWLATYAVTYLESEDYKKIAAK